jgi:predicted dehydrogenase
MPVLLQAAAPEPVRLPKQIRVAMIGFEGHTGEIFRVLPSMPDVRVVAYAESMAAERANPAPRRQLADARRYSNYRELLDKEHLDVVAVTNNNGERAEVVIECARRKLNVIAEKPLGLDWDQLGRVRKAVQDGGISLGQLMTMRYEPAYQALRKLVAEGVIGEVGQIDSQKSYKLGNRAEWFRDRKLYGSSILWIGIHMIDLMRWTSGRDLIEVAGFQHRVGFPELRDMETVSASAFRLDNGGTATLHMDYFRPETAPSHGDDRLRLAGTRGVLEYMGATGVTLITAAAAPTTITKLPPSGSSFRDYLLATYAGAAPGITEHDIWRMNEITIAAHQAAETGRVLRTTSAP